MDRRAEAVLCHAPLVMPASGPVTLSQLVCLLMHSGLVLGLTHSGETESLVKSCLSRGHLYCTRPRKEFLYLGQD